MKSWTWLLVPLAFLLALAGTAFAGTAAAGDEGSLLELARPVLEAVLARDPGLAAVLALILAAGAARRYGGRYVPWLNTDAGGVALVLVMSAAGAVAAAFRTGAAFGPALIWTSIGVAITSIGGWKALKTLLVDPLLGPLAERHTWLRPLRVVLDVIFRKPDPVAGAVAAGKAAVAANPAPGPATKFTDVP